MNYNEFTRMAPIIKAVRFELLPCGRTREYLDAHNVLSSDIERKQNVEAVSDISDSFVREFIETLRGDYEWSKLYDVYNTPEFRQEAEKMKEKIASDINEKYIDYLNEYAKIHGISGKISFPSSAYIDDVLPVYASLSDKYNSREYAEKLLSLRRTSSTLFARTFSKYKVALFGTSGSSIAGRMIENILIAIGNKAIYDRYNDTIEFGDGEEVLGDIGNMNACMSQSGIDTYNELISGTYNSEGTKLKKGINERINEYNQCNPDAKIPTLRKLYKQIMTDSEPAFHVDVIESRAEFDKAFVTIKEMGDECGNKIGAIVKKLVGEYDANSVYISIRARREMSERLCDSWSYIDGVLEQAEIRRIKEEYCKEKGKIKNKLTQKEEKKVHTDIAMHISSISELDAILSDAGALSVAAYITDLFEGTVKKRNTAYNDVMRCTFWENDKKPQWIENESIRRYVDYVLEIANMVPIFVVDNSVVEADVDLRERIDELTDMRSNIIKMYNLIKNYLTKKTDCEAKKKSTVLMFGRSAHLNQSWLTVKEGCFGNADAAILEMDGRYYYMVSGAAKQRLAIPMLEESDTIKNESYYNCLYTKTSGHISMMLPKCTFASKQAKESYAKYDEQFEFEIVVGNNTMLVSKKMYDDYAAKTFRQNGEAKNVLINYAKEFISKHESYKGYDFSCLREAEEYSSYGEFCDEVDSITFRVVRKYIRKQLVDEAVENGNVYLFMISNHDMYKEDKRCKDKTSRRFRAIIEGMFSGDTSIIINNSPIIQYRPAVTAAEPTHPRGSMLVNKLTSAGEKIPDDIYRELYEYFNHRQDKLSDGALEYKDKAVVKPAEYDHIRELRYSREMFTITLSYTINKSVTSAVTGYSLNKRVNEQMRKQGYNVLTVIRGVDNLLYYYLCDAIGEKISSGSLNRVGNVDYQERLNSMGRERAYKQQKWNYDMGDKVAAAKEAYLNEICRVIISLAVKNNAIIVIDQINSKAKNRASAFDDNVYKKFESKLVSALSDCFDTAVPSVQTGGILNPYQLASSENVRGNQNGIVFYVSNALTRNVCPDTGFVNVFAYYKVCTISAKRACLERMKKIYYDKEIGEFRYDFSFADIGSVFLNTDMPETIDRVWSIRTHMTRYTYDAAARQYNELNGTTRLIEYAGRNHILLDSPIDVSELDNEGVKLFYDVFVAYINGFVHRDGGSYYVSPVTGWCSIGADYDEMIAKQTAVKAGVMIDRVLSANDAKKTAVTKSEWYDMLASLV